MSVVYVNVHVLQKPIQNGMSVWRRLRQRPGCAVKNHYKRHQHRPHRCFRHFECRMCCKNQYERHAQQKHRPHRRFRHFGLGCAVKAIQTACRSFTSTSSMCCKNQCKRHVGLRAFTSDGAVKTTTNGTNIGHTGVFGTSGAGCAVKKVGANVL